MRVLSYYTGIAPALQHCFSAARGAVNADVVLGT